MSDKRYDIFFSVSRYGLQKDCLGKYYFKYIKNIETPFIVWPGTLFGTVVHSVIENIIEKYKSDDSFREGITNYKNGELKKSPATLIAEKMFVDEYESQMIKEKKRFRKSRDYDKEGTIKSGKKWVPKIIDFMIKVVGFDEVESEMKITSDVDKHNMRITSYLDIVKKEDGKVTIFDMKNTKYPQKFFFKDWSNDIQSNVYIALLNKEKNIQVNKFGYLVFSIEDSMMFCNGIEHSGIEHINTATELVNRITDEFVENHGKADDTSLWSPEEQKCKWCEFSKACKVAK